MAGEWPLTKVLDLADTISETHKLQKDKLVFLNTSDVLLGKILHHSYSTVREWPGQAKKSIRRDDILFSEIRPANGRWAYVDVEAEDYVVSTKLMVIRPRRDRVLSQLLGVDDRVRIVDLSGVPNEVAGTASAAIARTLFYLKVWQTAAEREKSPVLLVCEEAHRYVPNSGEAQYEAAKGAIRRIAKEGRKYGIGLMLVSQRPSEVEATVLSQCNSWIVLRIT